MEGLRSLQPLGVVTIKQSLNSILVRFPNNLPDPQTLAGRLAGLDWMEPDATVSVAATPNDPSYPEQWNLAHINMPGAWDVAGTGTPSVVVAVVDTGVAYEDRAGFRRAPDLANTTFVPGYDFLAGDVYPDDQHGHGTFIAELIAAGWNNAWRAAGIAGSVSIMPLRVLDNTGQGSLFDVAAAVRYATDNGARIINLSLAASPGANGSREITSAVDYAYSRGVLCVAAAGNVSGPVQLPASIPSVLAVSATDVNDTFASEYSNFGPEIDLAAPGGDSSSSAHQVPQESYSSWGNPSSSFTLCRSQGTSFSAAQVSGVAALMLSANPDLTPADLAHLLTYYCRDLGTPGRDDYYGAGLLDAAAAVRGVGNRNWYFAEGSTREGFHEYLCLFNSSGAEASASITYFNSRSEWRQQDVSVPASTRLTISVNDIVGPGWDVSVHVNTPSRALLVERPLYFSYQGKWTGGSSGTGSLRRAQLWYFAEGYTGSGFEEWLCLANPNGLPATVTVEYMSNGGNPFGKSYTVSAFSRRTLSVNAEAGGNREVSMRVTSDQPIVAERPMYFVYGGDVDGGHNVMGVAYPTDTWYFAEGTTRTGFDEYLTVMNPGDMPATISVDYLLGSGQGASVSESYLVPKKSRYTINVRGEIGSGKDVACLLRSDRPVVAERPMYFRYGGWTGGSDVAGANQASPRWGFTEGTTRTGFEEWLTLANPGGSRATVTVDYVLGSGQGASIRKTYDVPAGTRKTVYVPGEVGRERDVAALVHSSTPIVAERPMYFSYGAWTGGNDVPGYTDF